MNTSEHSVAVDATIREYVGRQLESDDLVEALSGESRAGLRQFSLERMMGYGIDYADAVELRARVLLGEAWCDAASGLADSALAQADAHGPSGEVTRAHYLHRSSALLRMSQAMMLTDTDERHAIYARAVELFGAAGELVGDREHVAISTDNGTLAGWIYPADRAVAATIVIGGVEGWAMDFQSLGQALAARGVTALMLDGPGQGESRFAHGTLMSKRWLTSYRQALDFLESRAAGMPLGIVGNSMGGGIAMAVAANDSRIRACCGNGGLGNPGIVPPEIGTFFWKMAGLCGVNDADESIAVWSSVTPMVEGVNPGYPLLIVHGGKDPMISTEMVTHLYENAPTQDKRMVVFSDGDHCIYNHRSDRDALIADWMRTRLTD